MQKAAEGIDYVINDGVIKIKKGGSYVIKNGTVYIKDRTGLVQQEETEVLDYELQE